mmetsp:Transcript_14489/g.42230  ORF Transcript_14489/g.42230 Transcript_14489/m.42230 type:complete len:232 (+) Transcript_14489:9212-9907(+)
MVSVVPPPIEPVEGETDEMMSTASMGVEVWTAVVSADAPCCTVTRYWSLGSGPEAHNASVVDTTVRLTQRIFDAHAAARFACVRPLLPSSFPAGSSHTSASSSASIPAPSVRPTSPPAPLVGNVVRAATLAAAAPSDVTSTVEPHTAESTTEPPLTTESVTVAAALAAPLVPGKSATRPPWMHDSTGQSTPPIETLLAAQSAASMPCEVTLTSVHPAAESVDGDTSEMDST